MTTATPRSDVPTVAGFRMPAEWEPHKATWLTWPHDEAHWPGLFEKIPPIWARMVCELEKGEEVHLLMHDAATRTDADRALAKAGAVGRNVFFHEVHNNFSWARDHGPIFLRNGKGEVALIHWGYNAWGGKWASDLDRKIPAAISKITGIPRIEAPMILEGGSIDVNGAGTLLTTESCLLNPNRNPTLTREQIEGNLRDYLGVQKVLWLAGEVAGDDTDGHVDDLARFVAPRTVLAVVETDASDVNHLPLKENVRRLQGMKDADGLPLEVLEVSLPKTVFYEGERLPASYANFYIGNEAVLLPVFNDPADRKAVDVLERAFPRRRIVPIPSRELVWGFGAFHCVTQQQPA